MSDWRAGLRRFPIVSVMLLLIAIPSIGFAQSAASSKNSREELTASRPDALAMLKQVCERYPKANYYHIEKVDERQMNGDLLRDWSKSLTTAIMAPGNRYRFEAHDGNGWWIQVSDGKNEWEYNGDSQEYTQQPTPASGPTRFNSAQYRLAFQMNQAQSLLTNIAHLPRLAVSATYLPDETLDWNGKEVKCLVIEADGSNLPKMPAGVIYRTTFWIEKDKLVIRKIHTHEEGSLVAMFPHRHYVSDRTTSYPVADLDAPAMAESLFAFDTPSTGKLVKEFNEPMFGNSSGSDLTGKTVPTIDLRTTEGKTVSLESFRGKPVLIDFWATSCEPCLDSMPSLEKLYKETSNKGLVLLSVDEDEEAKTAADFFAEHKQPWPNFHSNDEIQRALPHNGIPFFVLVDPTGKIVFAKSGFDEDGMRAAIAKLGPQFAGIAGTGKE